MNFKRLVLMAWICAGICGGADGAEKAVVTPLRQAHAHNDYLHARPLLDALEQGFCSVEADVHLVDGKLLVAHDADKVNPARTLEGLYLDPLRERIRRNGGSVQAGGAPFSLLIDVKTEAAPTYGALTEVLKRYADILSAFSGGQVKTNAVTVIVSGNRDPELMRSEALRYAGMDGRAADLGGTEPATLMPWISDNWTKLFKWRGVGPMPEAEHEKLRALVKQTHAQGRRLRLWATPDKVEVWRELAAAEVDLINTDDLAGLREYLEAKGR